jgi:hypothetical protein
MFSGYRSFLPVEHDSLKKWLELKVADSSLVLGYGYTCDDFFAAKTVKDNPEL